VRVLRHWSGARCAVQRWKALDAWACAWYAGGAAHRAWLLWVQVVSYGKEERAIQEAKEARAACRWWQAGVRQAWVSWQFECVRRGREQTMRGKAEGHKTGERANDGGKGCQMAHMCNDGGKGCQGLQQTVGQYQATATLQQWRSRAPARSTGTPARSTGAQHSHRLVLLLRHVHRTIRQTDATEIHAVWLAWMCNIAQGRVSRLEPQVAQYEQALAASLCAQAVTTWSAQHTQAGWWSQMCQMRKVLRSQEKEMLKLRKC